MTRLWEWARERVAFLAALAVILGGIHTSCERDEPPAPVTTERPPPAEVAEPAVQRPATPQAPAFADEFTGAAGAAPDGALWRLKLTDEWQPAPELQTYTDARANAALTGDGHLAITAHAVAGGWTSARLHSRSFFHYGRFEARLRLPVGAGAWGAFWLLGDDSSQGWPACGEIDVIELPAAESGRAYAGTHQPGAGSGGLIAPLPLADPAGWHTYAVDWRPGQLVFYTDGTYRGAVTRAAIESAGGVWVFDDQPQQMILNLAIGGWGGTPGPWTQQVMLVDYVRVTA